MSDRATDERDRPLCVEWLRASAARGGARAGEGGPESGDTGASPIRDDGRFRRRSLARSPKSTVGSSQRGPEKASRRSERLRPMSASMWRSRPASAAASRRWRRARAISFSQRVTRANKARKARVKAPPAMGRTGMFSLMSVSMQFAGYGRQMAVTPAPEPPGIPTQILRRVSEAHIAPPLLISETNVFNLIHQDQ